MMAFEAMSEKAMEQIMNTELTKAKETLFGPAGLGVSNFKLYPGTSRETTAEDIAKEINQAVAQIASGDFDALDFSAGE